MGSAIRKAWHPRTRRPPARPAGLRYTSRARSVRRTPMTCGDLGIDQFGTMAQDASQCCADIDDLSWLDQHGTNDDIADELFDEPDEPDDEHLSSDDSDHSVEVEW